MRQSTRSRRRRILCGLKRWLPLSTGVAILLLAAGRAQAEHAVIELRVIKPDNKEVSASSDQDPPPGGVNDVPLMKVEAGEPLVLEYFLTNVYPHGRIKNVTVRYYVAHTHKLGRKRFPSAKDLEENVVTRGKVTMNFKPKCRVGARLKFRVPEPGLYTVRVDTLNTESDHEHFSAIDLKAE